MRAAGLVSITRILSPRMKYTGGSGDNHDIEGGDVRQRAWQGGEADDDDAEGGETACQDVPHQLARCAQSRGPAARRWLGRYAGAVPDRQEIRRRGSRGRLDCAQA